MMNLKSQFANTQNIVPITLKFEQDNITVKKIQRIWQIV